MGVSKGSCSTEDRKEIRHSTAKDEQTCHQNCIPRRKLRLLVRKSSPEKVAHDSVARIGRTLADILQVFGGRMIQVDFDTSHFSKDHIAPEPQPIRAPRAKLVMRKISGNERLGRTTLNTPSMNIVEVREVIPIHQAHNGLGLAISCFTQIVANNSTYIANASKACTRIRTLVSHRSLTRKIPKDHFVLRHLKLISCHPQNGDRFSCLLESRCNSIRICKLVDIPLRHPLTIGLRNERAMSEQGRLRTASWPIDHFDAVKVFQPIDGLNCLRVLRHDDGVPKFVNVSVKAQILEKIVPVLPQDEATAESVLLFLSLRKRKCAQS
eukprot:m.99211 g.99211  ORF g.99211 m.99211 type:complete len:324 (+) comp51437_c0_seq9:2939-3910(+)